MIPISDENPMLRTPIATWVLLGLTVLAFVLLQGAGLDQVRLATSVCDLGMVPGELTRLAPVGLGVPIGPGMACVVDRQPINVLTPLTSMFLHGGWGHLLGNALFFWVFGTDVEDSMGRLRFVLFYVLCGLLAAGAHVAIDPSSPIPTVGASGAISGVMGAYLALYPRARVRMLFVFFIFIRVIPLPAWLVLLWWIGWQLLAGLPQLVGGVDPEVSGSGVAFWAHIGGFLAGLLLVRPFAVPALVARRRALHRQLFPWRY